MNGHDSRARCAAQRNDEAVNARTLPSPSNGSTPIKKSLRYISYTSYAHIDGL